MSFFRNLFPHVAKDSDSDREAARSQESKTHRHLKAGETVRNGDIYGGSDLGFITTIGQNPDNRPREGELCDALLGYRIRRRK